VRLLLSGTVQTPCPDTHGRLLESFHKELRSTTGTESDDASYNEDIVTDSEPIDS